MLEWVPANALDAPALICGNVRQTWRELTADVDGIARALVADGVEPQQRIRVGALPLGQQIPLILGVLRAGAVVVLPHRALSQAEADARACDVGATRVIDGVPAPQSRGHLPPPRHEDALVDILFSSGSTGAPKAIGHTALGHAASADAVAERTRFEIGDGWGIGLPLSHVGGLCVIMRACRRGGAIVIPDASPATLAQQSACTHLSAVPTQLWRALDDTRELSAWQKKKTILIGGAAVPKPLAQRIEATAFDGELLSSYGMTELTSTAAIASKDKFGRGMRALPHLNLRVVDGRILASGPSCARVISATSAAPLPREAEFDTGDLGHFDADGDLVVTGRAGRMFVSGGENVHPERIETALLDAGARVACVVGVADPEWGARAVAFVACDCELDAVVERARAGLARYETPSAVHPWPEGMSETKPNHAQLVALAVSR